MKHRGLRHRYGCDGCQEPLLYVEIIETSLLNALEETPWQSKVYDDLIDFAVLIAVVALAAHNYHFGQQPGHRLHQVGL